MKKLGLILYLIIFGLIVALISIATNADEPLTGLILIGALASLAIWTWQPAWGVISLIALHVAAARWSTEIVVEFGGNNYEILTLAYLIGLPLIVLFAWLKQLHQTKLPTPWWWLLLIILWSVVSLTFVIDVNDSFTVLTSYTLYLLIGLAGYLIAPAEFSTDKIKRNVSLIALMPLIFGTAEFFLNANEIFTSLGDFRLTSTFTHPNQYGYFLAFLIVCWFSYLLREKTKLTPPNLLISSLLLFNLLFTFSRGAWVAVILGVVILLFLERKSTLKHSTLFLTTLIAISLISNSLLSAFTPSYADNQTTVTEQVQAWLRIDDASTDSIEWRWELWQDLAEDVPSAWWQGYGVGSMREVVFRNQDLKYGPIDEDLFYFTPHNNFLRFQLELGLVGLVLFIGLLLSLILWPWRAAAKTASKDSQWLLKTLSVWGMVYLSVSLFDNLIGATSLWWAWMWLLGLAAAQLYQQRKS